MGNGELVAEVTTCDDCWAPDEKADFLSTVKSVVGQRGENGRNGTQAYDLFVAMLSVMHFYVGDVPGSVALPLLKLCRLACDPGSLDSWVDLAGYAKLGYDSQ